MCDEIHSASVIFGWKERHGVSAELCESCVCLCAHLMRNKLRHLNYWNTSDRARLFPGGRCFICERHRWEFIEFASFNKMCLHWERGRRLSRCNFLLAAAFQLAEEIEIAAVSFTKSRASERRRRCRRAAANASNVLNKRLLSPTTAAV